MSGTKSPIFIVLSTDNMDASQVEKINELTRELARELSNRPETVASVSFGTKDDLPKGAKVALELALAEQVLIEVVPILVPWVLGKVDAIIKFFSARGERVKANVIVGTKQVEITPKTDTYELNRSVQQIRVINELSPYKRYALVIGNSNYLDTRIPNLNSSIVDAERFASALEDSKIGSFDEVRKVTNKNNEEIQKEIESFFGNRHPDDMLVLYYSGHGIKSHAGQLFLTAQNTSSDLLKSTGISANFIRENMNDSASKRQVLILDCCYGGAIMENSKSESLIGQSVNSLLTFQPTGSGKIIITASEAMQYAFDGRHVEGEAQNSAFTTHLINGLLTGDADTDKDGLVDIDELYQYVHRKVAPQQNPVMNATAQEGRMYIGLNPNPEIQLASLPGHIQDALQSETRLHRQGAVSELNRLLRSEDPALVLTAESALNKMTNDDSKSVADLAREALEEFHRQRLAMQGEREKTVAPTPKSAPAQAAPMPAAPQSPYRTTPPVARPAPSGTGRRAMNETAIAWLNVLLPGYVYTQTGQWFLAVLTFVISATLTIFFISIGLALLPFSLVCAFPLMIGQSVFLFFQARNVVRKQAGK